MVCNLLRKNDTKTIKEALKALNKKNFVLIMHANSFPSLETEDTGMGNIHSKAAQNLISWAGERFNAIQLGPNGATKGCDSSPYTGTIFSSNPLFIDLKQLTTKKWGNILSEETFNNIVGENSNKNKAKTYYSYIFKRQSEALKEAYNNFKSIKAKDLKKEMEYFRIQNKFWLEKDALYEALSIENGNDYWPMWASEIDKNLFNPQSNEERIKFAERIKEIEKKYAEEIEFYIFVQFVAYMQTEETLKFAKSKGISLIADRQVAFSDRDSWAYQSLFLKNWCLGCPPDYFSKDGQAWGFPVLNPEMLFNAEGSLGEAGLLLKELYKKMFKENPGGVRIDHIVGLIDPWVYKKGSLPKIEEGAGRLYSSPEHPELGQFAIAKKEDLDLNCTPDNEYRVKTLSEDQIKKYGQFVEKIVIAAAKEMGLNKNAIVCEDLGTLTNPVDMVMKKYELNGMRLTQFVIPTDEDHPYRGKNITANSWAMVGTHDNEPIMMWAEKLINTHEGYLHAKNLVEDLFAEAENKDEIIVKLTKDAKFLAETKLVEILASKSENIQIFFTDFFNIKAVYNIPGTSGDENWSLRLPNNFEKLETINLENILKEAILARGSKFAKKYEKLIKQLS